ncbi:hypothetical protein ES705_09983 [subsurface metagenome]
MEEKEDKKSGPDPEEEPWDVSGDPAEDPDTIQAIRDIIKAESKKKPKTITRTIIPGLIHLIQNENCIKYLVMENEILNVHETVKIDNQLYRPKQELPFYIPGNDIMDDLKEIDGKLLLDDTMKFIKKYLEMPHEDDYLILALWIFHTYLIEKAKATPILYFHGVKETGKTRAGEVLFELAYKCERLTAPTEASLFRTAHYFKTSLIIDEIRLWGKDGNKEVADLIKSRYKRGLKVCRIEMRNKGEDQLEYFDVFAPLCISTTESMPDIIESRCLRFVMQTNVSQDVEADIDLDEAYNLRKRFTIFRANRYNKELPDPGSITRGRMNEITMPLYRILTLIDIEKQQQFKDFVSLVEMNKADEEGESLEAEITVALKEIPGDVKFVSYKDLTATVNENKDDPVSSYLVACRIKRLGFSLFRSYKGRGFIPDPELIKKLIIKYNT